MAKTGIKRNQRFKETLRIEREGVEMKEIGKEIDSIIGSRGGAGSRIETETSTKGGIRRRTWRIKKRKMLLKLLTTK